MNDTISFPIKHACLSLTEKNYSGPKKTKQTKKPDFYPVCLLRSRWSLHLVCFTPGSFTTEILLIIHGLVVNAMSSRKSSQISAFIQNPF